jgi:L-fuculose-phosphate aldolase
MLTFYLGGIKIKSRKENQTIIKQNKEKYGGFNMFSEYEVKKQICEIGKRIYMNGFVAANDGNITVKINDNELLSTPTGVSKGFMTPEMICKVNMKGEVISASGKHRPSSELKMHLRVYNERPDVKSVVHAHPPFGTSFAIAGIPLVKPIMPEAVISLGCVPIAAYGTPSTNEIPDAISKYLQNYDALLLENHGALTYGEDLITAYYKMESLEFYAKLTYYSTMLGGPKELNSSQVDDLIVIREKLGVRGRHPGKLCADGSCGIPANSTPVSSRFTKEASKTETESLVEEITRRVIKELNKA